MKYILIVLLLSACNPAFEYQCFEPKDEPLEICPHGYLLVWDCTFYNYVPAEDGVSVQQCEPDEDITPAYNWCANVWFEDGEVVCGILMSPDGDEVFCKNPPDANRDYCN